MELVDSNRKDFVKEFNMISSNMTGVDLLCRICGVPSQARCPMTGSTPAC